MCCLPSAIFVGVQRICLHRYAVNSVNLRSLKFLGDGKSQILLILSGCFFQHPMVTKLDSSLANSNSPDDPVLSGSPQDLCTSRT